MTNRGGRTFRLTAIALAAVATLVGAGCLSPAAPPSTTDELNPSPVPPTFLAPAKVNGAAHAYEPSLVLDSAGNRYITAHKSGPVAGPQMASWFWTSPDGRNWSAMPSPADGHTLLWGLEGDLAVDAEDRIYFVDTYLADLTLGTWQGGPSGPEWVSSRPIMGTVSRDDRPWLAAHGDGILYYMGNNGDAFSAVDPANPTARGWISFTASEDGGLTWRVPETIGGSWWFCGLAADPADDVTVHRACNITGQGSGTVRAESSNDRGRTWQERGVIPRGPIDQPLYIASSVDETGTAFHVWVDDDLRDTLPAALRLGIVREDDMQVLDLPVHNQSIWKQWVAARGNGTVAVAYYTSPEVPTDDESPWFLRVLFSTPQADGPYEWLDILADPEPVHHGVVGPQDFFQARYGRDGLLHIAYQREAEPADATEAFLVADIYYIQQAPTQ